MELPGAEALAWIVRTYAELRAAHGEVIGDPDLVLPTSDFFPDEVTATPEGVATLLKRTMSYAPLASDLRVGLEIVAPGDKDGGSCSSGGCGGGASGEDIRSSVRLFEEASEEQSSYILTLSSMDGGNPVRLTSSIARGVGALVLQEAGENADGAESEARAEIAAIVCGLGLLVFSGSYIYAKGCGGARVHRTTSMAVSEVAAALALFVRVHGVKPGVVRGHLATTQKEAFDLALDWIDGNERIVEKMRSAPELLVGGAFDFEPPRGLFGRLFAGLRVGSSKPKEPLSDLAHAMVTAPKARVRSEAEMRRLAEAKALVEEALRGA